MVPGEDPVIRLARPDTGAEEAAAVAEVLESGMLTMGEKVAELEAGLAAACEVEHAVAVSSGTAALHLAVLALGIGPGDEVIVPAYTFPATANVVALAGATPVLVDVDPATNNIDPAKVEVTPRTKAIMPVHLFGRPARLEELPDLPLIEDAAGALGARHRGRACGGLGAAGCLSFHPRKIVTTGEGGAVTTNDADLAERVRSLRHHGWSPSNAYDDMPAGAFNYRIPDILCAIGIPQVAKLEELLAAPRARSRRGYAERLRDLAGRAPRGRRGRPPRLAGVRHPARPPRRGDGRPPRAGDPVPDRHVRAAPPLRLPRPGQLPRRGRLLRALPGAPAAHAGSPTPSSTASPRP